MIRHVGFSNDTMFTLASRRRALPGWAGDMALASSVRQRCVLDKRVDVALGVGRGGGYQRACPILAPCRAEAASMAQTCHFMPHRSRNDPS